jgi:hypothetical protein
MMAIRQTDPVLQVQLLLINPAAKPGHVTDGQVCFAGLQRPFRVAVDTRRFQPDTGRLLAHVRQHSRQ